MPITERDFDSLKEIIQSNHDHIVRTLEVRKEYFDSKFKELCAALHEMKTHCVHVQDNCGIIFKEYDRRIDKDSEDITKIKTVRAVLGFAWGAFVTAATHILRNMTSG